MEFKASQSLFLLKGSEPRGASLGSPKKSSEPFENETGCFKSRRDRGEARIDTTLNR